MSATTDIPIFFFYNNAYPLYAKVGEKTAVAQCRLWGFPLLPTPPWNNKNLKRPYLYISHSVEAGITNVIDYCFGKLLTVPQ